MNEYIIEIVLMLFWAGFLTLNLWLWKRPAQDDVSVEQSNINDKEVGQGERHATYHH